MRRLQGLLLLSLLSAGSASAEPLTDDVRKYLAAARALHKSLAFEDALVQVSKAERAAQKPVDDVAVNMLKGVVLRELGRTEEAENAFRTALTLEPLAGLPVVVSPTIKAEFDALRLKISGRAALPPLERPAPKVEVVTDQLAAPVEAARPTEVAVTPAATGATAVDTTQAPARSTTGNIVGVVAGGVMMAGGALLFYDALHTTAAIRRGDSRQFFNYRNARDAEVSSSIKEGFSYPLFGIGAAVTGASLLLWPKSLESEDEEIEAGFSVGAGQAFVSMRGTF